MSAAAVREFWEREKAADDEAYFFRREAAKELRVARMAKDLTLQEVGDLLGVSRVVVNFWELGRRPVPENKREKLLEILGG